MKIIRLGLVLAVLLMMATTAMAYNTIVTLTITSINGITTSDVSLREVHAGNPVNMLLSNTCPGSSNSSVVQVKVGTGISFLCDLTSGNGYNIILGRESYQLKVYNPYPTFVTVADGPLTFSYVAP